MVVGGTRVLTHWVHVTYLTVPLYIRWDNLLLLTVKFKIHVMWLHISIFYVALLRQWGWDIKKMYIYPQIIFTWRVFNFYGMNKHGVVWELYYLLLIFFVEKEIVVWTRFECRSGTRVGCGGWWAAPSFCTIQSTGLSNQSKSAHTHSKVTRLSGVKVCQRVLGTRLKCSLYIRSITQY